MALPTTTRSLPISLMRAREQVMAPIRKMLANSDITEQQWRVLRVLSEAGPMDATSLADRSCLLVPSLTRIAQSMKTKGLVTQEPDPEDRRRQMIAITNDGQNVIDENMEEANLIAQGFRNKLGDDNFEKLIDLLNLLDEESNK